MPNNKISDYKKRTIDSMSEEGISSDVIARELGVSLSSVVRVRKECE